MLIFDAKAPDRGEDVEVSFHDDDEIFGFVLAYQKKRQNDRITACGCC